MENRNKQALKITERQHEEKKKKDAIYKFTSPSSKEPFRHALV